MTRYNNMHRPHRAVNYTTPETGFGDFDCVIILLWDIIESTWSYGLRIDTTEHRYGVY